TIVAEESLSGLALDLEVQPLEDGKPSAESAPQSFKHKKLGAGQKVVFKLGGGKVGATRWHGMIQCQVEGKLWKQEIVLVTHVTRKLEIRFDPNYRSSHLSIEQH